MRSSELRAHSLPVHRFREGYAIGEVDDFLELCAEALATYELRRHPTSLRPSDIVHTQFSVTRFRGGYDADAVDDLLDRVVVALRDHEKQAGRSEGSP